MDDVLYRLSSNFHSGVFKVDIQEYTVNNETTKSYMGILPEHIGHKWRGKDKVTFPKEQEGTVVFDHYNGHLFSAVLFLTEVSRDDVESHGVNLLKEKLREWLDSRARYYTNRIQSIDKHK